MALQIAPFSVTLGNGGRKKSELPGGHSSICRSASLSVSRSSHQLSNHPARDCGCGGKSPGTFLIGRLLYHFKYSIFIREYSSWVGKSSLTTSIPCRPPRLQLSNLAFAPFLMSSGDFSFMSWSPGN